LIDIRDTVFVNGIPCFVPIYPDNWLGGWIYLLYLISKIH